MSTSLHPSPLRVIARCAAGIATCLLVVVLGGCAGQQAKTGSGSAAVEAEAKTVMASIDIDAPNWRKNSSPFIVHFKGIDDVTGSIDFYHAVSAGDTESATVELETGRYEVSYVSAINPDGSIYMTPDEPATVVIGEVDDSADDDATDDAPAEDAADDATGTPEADAPASDGDASDDASETASEEEPTLEIGGSFEQVPAENVTQDDIDDILGDLADAVEKGDETLSGDAGQAVVDTATGNAGNAPNVDKDEVEQAGEEASDAVAEEPTEMTKPSTSGNGGNTTSGNSSSSSGSSTSSGSASKPSDNGSSSGSSNKPAHKHTWVAQTERRWVQDSAAWDEPVYETQKVYTYHAECKAYKDDGSVIGCGASATFSSGAEADNWCAEHLRSHIGDSSEHFTHWWSTTEYNQVQTGTIHHEATGHYETVTTGYKCSGCGATK